MVSIDHIYKVSHGLFKKPIIGPIKLKMVDGHMLQIVKSPYLNEKSSNFDEISYKTAHLKLDDSQLPNMNVFKIQDGGRPPF